MTRNCSVRVCCHVRHGDLRSVAVCNLGRLWPRAARSRVQCGCVLVGSFGGRSTAWRTINRWWRPVPSWAWAPHYGWVPACPFWQPWLRCLGPIWRRAAGGLWGWSSTHCPGISSEWLDTVWRFSRLAHFVPWADALVKTNCDWCCQSIIMQLASIPVNYGILFNSVTFTLVQGSFCVCPQPMRVSVTL